MSVEDELVAAQVEAEKWKTRAIEGAQEWKRAWLASPVLKTFVNFKHGIVGDVLFALQEGEISRGKAAEALAEIAHGATSVRLPKYRGIFGEDENPCDVVESLRARIRELEGVK
jgi:hypothetical protein